MTRRYHLSVTEPRLGHSYLRGPTYAFRLYVPPYYCCMLHPVSLWLLNGHGACNRYRHPSHRNAASSSATTNSAASATTTSFASSSVTTTSSAAGCLRSHRLHHEQQHGRQCHPRLPTAV